MFLPPLYPITDTRLEVSLSGQIARLGAAGFPLVQFRAKGLDLRTQWAELQLALRASAERGGWPAVCVNDRADLALLAAREGLAPWGLHLGQRDLPPSEARRLPGLEGLQLGTSTHQPAHWNAVDPACGHAGIGPVHATATKADHAEPVGLEGLADGCRALRRQGLAPVAIGGLTLADAPACFRAGAESLAMVGAVARAEAPGELLWQAQLARWRVRPPLAPGRGVVLMGGRGAGKACLGRALAERLGCAFRKLEAPPDRVPAAVAACLASRAVVALDADAWELPATRDQVRASGFTPLWLAEDPERAWGRIAWEGPRDRFMNHWASRAPRWWEAPMVLPLGRSAEALARALAPEAGA